MPPEDVRCTALSSDSLQLSWQPPQSVYSNGIIQGYRVIYEPMLIELWPPIDRVEVSIK